MSIFTHDLRYAARGLLKRPGHAAAAILSLAIGLGANTALFSVVNTLLLRPLPYPEPDRLGLIWLHSPGLDILRDWPSPGQFIDLRTANHSFEDMALAIGRVRTMTGVREPVRVEALSTSSSLLKMLGARPLLGRALTPADDRPGEAAVAILSHGFWQRQFGGDPTVVGRSVTIDGAPVAVAGVLGPELLLNGEVIPTVGGIQKIDLFLPLPLAADAQQNRGDESYNVVVRLKRDVAWQAAQADVDRIAARIREVDRRDPSFGMTVTPLLEQVVGDVRRSVLILFGSVALVLLVACANVANLLLALAASREKEFAMRTALGAGQGTLIRQLLTEAMTLSALGGALGLGVAGVTLAVVRAINPGNVPRLEEIALDARVLGFTLLVSTATGIFFGLAPALRARRVDVAVMLKSGGRSGGADGGLGIGEHRVRGLLVVGEVALSLTLLVGAGLLVRSFAALSTVAPGFDPERVLSLQVLPSGGSQRKPEELALLYERITDAVEHIPGIRNAGATSVLPFTPSIGWGSLTVDGYAPPPGQPELQIDQRSVTPDYFAALGVPLKAGRVFLRSDGAKSQRVALVDEKMANHFWPRDTAIGKRIRRGDAGSPGPWFTIVGVVGVVKQYGLEIDGRMVAYFPHEQEPRGVMYLAVKGETEPSSTSRAVAEAIRSADAEVAVADVATMTERVHQSLARQRFATVMLTAFAGFALLLAVVGIYSVMAYLVAQGTRDIGVRMALGAAPGAILRMVFRQGLILTLAGLGAGLAGAQALTRLMSSLLFGVSASDAVTFSAVAAVLGAAALLATYVPARRATRVDPLIALRSE